jgi:hypothetical protein
LKGPSEEYLKKKKVKLPEPQSKSLFYLRSQKEIPHFGFG